MRPLHNTQEKACKLSKPQPDLISKSTHRLALPPTEMTFENYCASMAKWMLELKKVNIDQTMLPSVDKIGNVSTATNSQLHRAGRSIDTRRDQDNQISSYSIYLAAIQSLQTRIQSKHERPNAYSMINGGSIRSHGLNNGGLAHLLTATLDQRARDQLPPSEPQFMASKFLWIMIN